VTVRFIVCEYDLPRSPMRTIHRRKFRNHEPKAVEIEDVRKMYWAAGDNIRGLRDRALILFLLDTGCRAAGVIGLTDERLNLEQGWAIVQEKGGPPRTVYFEELVQKQLRAWLAVRPEHATTVFCSLASNTYGRPMSYEGLSGVLKRLKRQAGVTRRVNAHSFRHAYARRYIHNGGEIASLSQLMGHADVTTTVHFYTIFSQRELAEWHKRFGPLKGFDIGENE
jgi:integrase/recombinase XerD